MEGVIMSGERGLVGRHHVRARTKRRAYDFGGKVGPAEQLDHQIGPARQRHVQRLGEPRRPPLLVAIPHPHPGELYPSRPSPAPGQDPRPPPTPAAQRPLPLLAPPPPPTAAPPLRPA